MTMRAVALLCCLIMAGCGFEPVYEDKAASLDVRDVLSRIEIVAPEGRNGDQLKAALEDHFYQKSISETPRYRLELTLSEQSEAFIIDPAGISSRFDLTLRSHFTLTRVADNAMLKRGRVARRVSYNVSEDIDYSTYISQKDAIKRGIDEIAEDLRMRITALFSHAIDAS